MLERLPAVADVELEGAEEGRPEEDHLVVLRDVDIWCRLELKQRTAARSVRHVSYRMHTVGKYS